MGERRGWQKRKWGDDITAFTTTTWMRHVHDNRNGKECEKGYIQNWISGCFFPTSHRVLLSWIQLPLKNLKLSSIGVKETNQLINCSSATHHGYQSGRLIYNIYAVETINITNEHAFIQVMVYSPNAASDIYMFIANAWFISWLWMYSSVFFKCFSILSIRSSAM